VKRINSSSVISIIFILGILVMINAIAVRNFLRLDLTSSKMYSLSQTSKDIVSNVEDRVIVKAYFSPDLPSPYNNTARYLRDMLEDYRAYSKGHFEYEFIDPGSEEALQQEAQSFQIPPRQFQTVNNDKFEALIGYMGVVFIYGDKKEIIPILDDIVNLEYEITSIINRLTSPELPKLGMASTGTEGQQVTMQKFYEALGRNYNVRPVNLDEPIGEDFYGVFLIAPRQPLTEWQLFNLDQYIINGGKLAILANHYEVFSDQYYARRMDLNLNDFLNNYGIAIGEDMVVDNRAANASVPHRRGFFIVNVPKKLAFFPSIGNFNRGNIITRGLDQLQTFFPSSVDTTLAEKKGFEVEGLLYSSELSDRERGITVQMPISRDWVESDFKEKNIPVAAIVKGKFTSFFAESGPPLKPIFEYNEGVKKKIGEMRYDGPFTASSDIANRLLVVGDGNIALDNWLNNQQVTQMNLMFLENTADWLVQSENLISIRSKQVVLKPLRDVPNIAKKTIKWTNQIGPVILVIILGILLWQFRNFRKKRYIIQLLDGVNK